MSLFADFIGGTAEAAKTNIDNEMAEKAAQKREAWRMKMQEKYAKRAENRDELRQNRAAELAYDRAQIEAEGRQRAEEAKQRGLLQKARDEAKARADEGKLNRANSLAIAQTYAGSRGRNRPAQAMDFGFNSNPALDFIKNLTR